METFIKFLYEFLAQFFSGFWSIILGIKEGVIAMFNIPEYIEILNTYKNDLTMAEWALIAIAILCLIFIWVAVILLIYFIIKKYVKISKKGIEQEKLQNEIQNLNEEVAKLVQEKEDILAMKVSQLGLAPNDSATIEKPEEETGDENEENEDISALRFPKLCAVDHEYRSYRVRNYDNDFELKDLCYYFRNFAASKMKLYYEEKMIRLFIAALASTKLVILQGISGTGKTSLAYAWGKFLKNDSLVVSVQPSWKDRTELFGYFNEFTKKFNESELLRNLYAASFTDDINTVILDEMNIARVEYYFAEMLSILEMPNPNEWIIELVATGWENDPDKIVNGKIKLPVNTWYIGTINNDDSTFMVTDKVYDRAMPIDINTKGTYFKSDDVDAMNINFSYVDKLFNEAIEQNPLSEENVKKIEEMDNYVIQHFRVAFGNRIMMQLKKFAPVYVSCGGTEIEGIDYFLAEKVLRKFDQLNIAYIRTEIDPFISFLDKTFGKNKMSECIAFLNRLKRMQ